MPTCVNIALVIIVVDRLVTASNAYRWYNIISNMTRNDLLMALDIDKDRVNSTTANVIICPWDETKLSQRWRWDGHMIKSYLNGLAMRVNEMRRVVLADPTNSEDQHFYTKSDGKYIYTDQSNSVHHVIQPTKGSTAIGTQVNVCNGLGRPYQYFVFKRLGGNAR